VALRELIRDHFLFLQLYIDTDQGQRHLPVPAALIFLASGAEV
jgi:hypothetical protein